MGHSKSSRNEILTIVQHTPVFSILDETNVYMMEQVDVCMYCYRFASGRDGKGSARIHFLADVVEFSDLFY